MGSAVPGFCGLKRGGPDTRPQMSTTDPNADLVGYRFPVDGGDVVVTGTTAWSRDYVAVTTPTGPSVRPAGVVRRRRELVG